MHFTIVIPLYNKEKYIRRALESIANQSISDYEVVVVDDGSIDDSAAVVKAFSGIPLRLISQKNGGEAVARNTGINAAKAQYIAFLDADDAWKTDHLATLSQLIKKYPGAGLYCTGYEFVEPSGEVARPQLFNVPESGPLPRYFQSVASGDQVATASSACIPAAVFRQLGCFSVGDVLGADQDMWARIALQHEVVVDRKSTAIYFRDADNRICVSEKHVSELPYSRRLQAYLDKNSVMLPAQQKEDIEAYIVKGLLTLVSLNIRGGQPAIAKSILRDQRLKQSSRTMFWKALTILPTKTSPKILSLFSYMRSLIQNSRSANAC